MRPSNLGVGSYTAWSDPQIDRHVAGLLARVVEAVVARAEPDLLAIVLAGGFGRGEGGVLRRPDGSLHVVNDFDIELVYREPLGPLLSKLAVQLKHRRAIGVLAESLAAEFGMKQVDLTLRGAHTLDATVPRLADFDLQHGRRLLWGATDPCERMPAFTAAQIPPFEGTWLLRNRGIGLLLARLYLDRGSLHAEDRENFYIEVNKALLAMGDALWILSGRYTVRYADRAAGFATLVDMGFPAMDELSRLYLQAAEYKLRPTLEQYPGQEPAALWRQATKLMLHFFRWHEAERLGRPLADLSDYAVGLGDPPARAGGSGIRRWLERQLGVSGDCPPSLRPLKHDPPRSVLFVMALLAVRLGDPVAATLLERWPVDATGTFAWQARVRGLLALMHPGGEVGRFLAATAAVARPRADEVRA